MISLPSRSGRIFLSSSCALSSAMRCLQAVLGPGQPGRLGLVPGGAVGPGEHVQPGQQRPGVPHVAADRGVRPLARRRTRGTAGAARSAWPRRPPPRREAQRLQPGPGHRRADRLVVVEGDPAVRQQRAGLAACRCRAAAPPAGAPGPAAGRSAPPARWTAPARSASAGTRPCAACARRSPAAAWAPRAAPRRPPRCPPAARSPAPGRRAAGPAAACSARRGSARPRRPLSRGASSAHGHRHLRGHGEAELRGEPGRAHDPQRVVGERLLRAARRAQHLVPQVAQAAERVDQLQRRAAGRPSRSP